MGREAARWPRMGEKPREFKSLERSASKRAFPGQVGVLSHTRHARKSSAAAEALEDLVGIARLIELWRLLGSVRRSLPQG